MNLSKNQQKDFPLNDPRFAKALEYFNNRNWYEAHDLFEELWHESLGEIRQTLQGILQIAVAQVHLENGNRNGATILYGEGLGRLKTVESNNLGIDIKKLCLDSNARLTILQTSAELGDENLPYLYSDEN